MHLRKESKLVLIRQLTAGKQLTRFAEDGLCLTLPAGAVLPADILEECFVFRAKIIHVDTESLRKRVIGLLVPGVGCAALVGSHAAGTDPDLRSQLSLRKLHIFSQLTYFLAELHTFPPLNRI